MLILPVTLILAVLGQTTLGAEYQSLTPNLVRSRRGLVEDARNAQDYTPRQSRYSNQNVRNVRGDNVKSYKSDKASPQESSSNDRKYDGSSAYDASLRKLLPYANLRHESRSNEPSPQFDKLFTMTASYKVANDKIKPSKQIDPQSFNQNSEGVYGAFPSFNVQLPSYQFNQPASKSSDSQTYTPYFQSNAYNNINDKKASIPQLQNNQDLSTYLTSFQPLLLNPTDYRFSFIGKAPKVNNVQQNSPFLSPFSSFHSQMVPISTTVNNPQFPRYKGASIQVYPTVGGYSTAAYQPLQAQPQLHFEHNAAQRVQPVGGLRQSTPSQEIRSDVEIIDKHPTTPPPQTDDDDDDEGHAPHDKEYKPDSDDEDYEDKPDRYFKAPRTEGDFKPSMSFPFKQYDEKFGKYSNNEEEIDDEDDEKSVSGKYQSKDTSSKPYYSRQEEEEDDYDGRSYERQETEDSSDSTYRPKNFDKDFEEGFESSYRRKPPKERYVHAKESSRKGESGDPSIQENRMSFRYHRVPQGFQDNEGYGSDNLASVVPEVVQEEAFGYRIPKETRNF